MRLSSLNRVLVPATLIYLSVPLIIFFLGWLKLPLAIASTLLLVALVYWCTKSTGASKQSEAFQVSWLHLMIGVLPIVAIALISGAGGVGFQDGDWQKHLSILKVLIEQTWPVTFPGEIEQGHEILLIYYIAYYLPAALIGKVTTWETANGVLFLTTLVGMILSYLWLLVLTRSNAILCGFFLCLFSGLDMIGILFSPPSISETTRNLANTWAIEWWAGLIQYSSNLSLIFWVPQQGLSGWLITALSLHMLSLGTLERWLGLILGLGVLWTPLATLGLIATISIFYLQQLLTRKLTLSGLIQRFLCSPMVFSLPVLLLLAAFLGTRLVIPEQLGFISHLPPLMPTVKEIQGMEWVRLYLLLILLEVGAPLLALRLLKATQREEKKQWRLASGAPLREPLFILEYPLFISAICVLVILPFFRYGYFNDSGMRASIPALFILQVPTLRALEEWRSEPAKLLRWESYLACAILGVGVIHSGFEIQRHLTVKPAQFLLPAMNQVKSLFDLQKQFCGSGDRLAFNFVGQYIGSTQSFFGQHLMKQSAPQIVSFIPKRDSSFRTLDLMQLQFRDSSMSSCADSFAIQEGFSSPEGKVPNHWRWASGPRSIIRFWLSEVQPLHITLQFTSPLPKQRMNLLMNGMLIHRFEELKVGQSVEYKTVSLPLKAGVNEIVMQYHIWNDEGHRFAPNDYRPLAVQFTKFELALAPRDEN